LLMSLKRFSISQLAVLLVAGGFGCANCTGSRPPGNRLGEVSYVVEVDGVQQIAKEGLYEFSPTPMGTTEPPSLKVSVRNTGGGALTLLTMEKSSGDAVKIGSGGDANPVFSVGFSEGTAVEPAGTAEFDVAFSPPVTPNTRVQEHEVKLAVRAGNATTETENTTLTIRGRAISGECEVPSVIDFGAVNVQNKTGRTVAFQNAGIVDAEALAGAIMSAAGDTVFSYKSDSATGEFIVEPNRTRDVSIEFSPSEARDYLATVRLRRAKGCPTVVVRLKGTGVNQCLTYKATPSTDANNARVDFGYVPPQVTVRGQVEIRNQCGFSVDVNSLRTNETTFTVTSPTMVTVPASSRDAMETLMPGVANVDVAFRPINLGTRMGNLVGNTQLANQSTMTVPLRGAGGGPDIDVRPAAGLNFGRVGYFAGAMPAGYVQRKLTIANVGTRPVPADVLANLRLGAGGMGKPYFEVRAVSQNASADELCVGVWDSAMQRCSDGGGPGAGDLPAMGLGSYDPGRGIEAAGAAALLDVPVRITPNGIGMKEWEIVVLSNDPDETRFTFRVRADVQVLPPCNADIAPTSLNFGVVTPPSTKDLSFKIRNRGTQPTDICYISGLELGPGTDPLFTLPNGDQEQVEIMPNAEYTVSVRAWPQGQLPPTVTRVQGSVVFSISSPTNPAGRVQLETTLAPTCLTVSPADLNFGTVQRDCNSPDKTFQVYNTCSTPVNISSTRWVSASRVATGTGACTNAMGCDEFVTVAAPANGMLAPGAMRSFQLKYRPYNLGPDTGAFAISATQNGQPVEYLVTVRGSGDTMGLNEDVFRQDSKPKADILFVIDNSGSMSEEQAFLASNFTAFLRYAIANQVDFQIGVTSTDNDAAATGGRLIPSPAGVKIYRPTTPNLEQQFAAGVVIGTNGSATEMCFEPALKALTAPLITDPAANLGFLRPDAVLAVVCVTDELEQSPAPVAQYVNQFLNIKGAQRANLFSLNAIGPFVQGASCTFDFDTLPTGRYSAAVAATNGVRENICTANWATALENLGKTAFGYRDTFFLTGRPESEMNITVTIDGVPLDRTNERGGLIWEYDSVTNAVRFQPLYVPEPGKAMTVRYQVACIQ
jgi:hypothetical protein